MKTLKIEQKYNAICENIINKKLGKAFNQIGKLLENSEQENLKENFLQVKQTFAFLLHYALTGTADPERENVYRKIQTDLLVIAGRIKDEQWANIQNSRLGADKRWLKKSIIKERLSSAKLLVQLNNYQTENQAIERELIRNKLFNFLWLSNQFSTEDYNEIRKSILGAALSVNEKSQITSAITIGILHNFNTRKINLLFEIYDTNQPQLWHRALAGLVIVLTFYSKRLQLYPKIKERIASISLDKDIKKFTEIIWMQFIKMKETQQISQKLHDEILPSMKKYGTDISDKLDLDKILSDSLIEDENPDWEEIFEDAPELLGKMAEFSELQMDGSDVFMSAFAPLKHFPFFKDAANWFAPFSKDNHHLKESVEKLNITGIEKLTGGLENAPFICNSDKYSFCLNLSMMPEAQRNMMGDLFKMENDSLEEIEKDDTLLNQSNDDKYIISRYLQDIYRFFKLHPAQAEVTDIFDDKLNYQDSFFIQQIDKKQEILYLAGELNFKKHFYKDASDAFLKLDINNFNGGKIYEKIGFSFQKLQDFENALTYYIRAELFGIESLWITKKLAFCYRKQKDFENALLYYRKAEKEEPDNLHTQANIGHCLLFSEKYEEALKYFFKVEYFAPKNTKIIRPLAWCAFAAGKSETAKKYALKIMENSPSATDYFNLAHLFLSENNIESALENYKKGIQKENFMALENSFKEDKIHLINNGVPPDKIQLVLDSLLLAI